MAGVAADPLALGDHWIESPLPWRGSQPQSRDTASDNQDLHGDAQRRSNQEASQTNEFVRWMIP